MTPKRKARTFGEVIKGKQPTTHTTPINKPKEIIETDERNSTRETREVSFHLAKSDDDKMLVFGWANVAKRADGSVVEDLQGDTISPDELEKAAYQHVLEFRSTGEKHDPALRSKGRLVESCVFTKDKQQAMGIPEGVLPIAWWVGYKIDDPETWRKIKSGDYKMFSIEGKGKRETIEKSRKARTFGEIMKGEGLTIS